MSRLDFNDLFTLRAFEGDHVLTARRGKATHAHRAWQRRDLVKRYPSRGQSRKSRHNFIMKPDFHHLR